MDDESLLSEQANAVARTLSGLMRCFSAIEDDDPATELPIAQIRVCAILRNGPRTMSAISSELGISLSAITQIADRLERSRMVERIPEEQDRRVKSLQLTAYGEDIIHRRSEKRVRRISQALALLPEESRSEVLSALRTLLEAGLAAHPAKSDTSSQEMLPEQLQ